MLRVTIVFHVSLHFHRISSRFFVLPLHFTASLRVSSHFLALSLHLIRVDQHSLVDLHFLASPLGSNALASASIAAR